MELAHPSSRLHNDGETMKRKNKPQLALDHASDLRAKIENEGDFLYVIRNWDFKDFKDKKFNSLRKAVIKAAQDLEDYCAFERLEEEEVDEMIEQGPCERCGDELAEDGVCYTCNDN